MKVGAVVVASMHRHCKWYQNLIKCQRFTVYTVNILLILRQHLLRGQHLDGKSRQARNSFKISLHHILSKPFIKQLKLFHDFEFVFQWELLFSVFDIHTVQCNYYISTWRLYLFKWGSNIDHNRDDTDWVIHTALAYRQQAMRREAQLTIIVARVAQP